MITFLTREKPGFSDKEELVLLFATLGHLETHQGIHDSPKGKLDTTITTNLEQKSYDLCCLILKPQVTCGFWALEMLLVKINTTFQKLSTGLPPYPQVFHL